MMRPDWPGLDTIETIVLHEQQADAVLSGCPATLRQVHGAGVIHRDDWHEGIEADAIWTDRPDQPLVVRTADCLPILIAHRKGRLVAAVHAGWRGLAAGVVDAVLDALPAGGESLLAWIGPAICGQCYQVGDEVREALARDDQRLLTAFRPDGRRWRADLKRVATILLCRRGVAVTDCRLCTLESPGRFPSHRRGDRERLLSGIWMSSSASG